MCAKRESAESEWWQSALWASAYQSAQHQLQPQTVLSWPVTMVYQLEKAYRKTGTRNGLLVLVQVHVAVS